jgi:hypothetical protein
MSDEQTPAEKEAAWAAIIADAPAPPVGCEEHPFSRETWGLNVCIGPCPICRQEENDALKQPKQAVEASGFIEASPDVAYLEQRAREDFEPRCARVLGS